jgi:hypothetical protein
MPLLKVNQIASYSGNTLTVGTTGDTVTLAAGASSSGFGATYNSGLNWTSTLVTSALTLTAGTGYFVNTSTAAITVTLPASPTFGSIVGIVDYSGYASTNNIIINPNGNKIEGTTTNQLLSNNGEGVLLNYIDTTRGWIPTSGINEGTDALEPNTYSIDFLVIAGGGGGGDTTSNYVAGGGGAGGYRTSTQTANVGTVITVTVGDGGTIATAGSNSSISGSGLTTITSAGGGFGGISTGLASAGSGGSGGGGGSAGSDNGSGGSGNTPSTSPSQGNDGANGAGVTGIKSLGSGGGGAGSAGNAGSGILGGNGGNGTTSSITGSSVTRAGGGGGATDQSNTVSTGGSGGGGNGGSNNTGATNATANTGSGGGGSKAGVGSSGSGGKGVVILSMLTTKYTGTTTGSPTVTTSGGNTILQFTGSGSYTA